MSSTSQNIPIKLAFVGLSTTGWAATALAPSLTQSSLKDHYSLVAVATTSPSSAAISANKWTKDTGVRVNGYHNAEGLLQAEKDVGMVAISVKSLHHRSSILPYIKAGKDFFVEWPAGKNLGETKELADEARKMRVRSLVGLQGRQGAALNKAKEIIESGKIGKVLSTNIIALVPREGRFWGPETGSANEYIIDKESGVTPLTIPLGHSVDWITYLLGQFSAIQATATTHYDTVTLIDEATNTPTGISKSSQYPDHLSVTGLLTSSVLANITWRVGARGSTPGRTKFLWEIDGEDGHISLRSDEVMGAFLMLFEPELYVNGENVVVKGAERGTAGMLERNWEEFTKGKKGRHATIEDAVRVKEVIAAVEKSIETGVSVQL